jgi:PadR family transcriptional regulator
MKNTNIGEFEELVLLSVAGLAEDAYAVSIQRKIENTGGRRASMGAVYTALERLEQKGHLNSDLGNVTHQRGGRRKRYYKITRSGIVAVSAVRTARENLWSRLSFDHRGNQSA